MISMLLFPYRKEIDRVQALAKKIHRHQHISINRKMRFQSSSCNLSIEKYSPLCSTQEVYSISLMLIILAWSYRLLE